MEQLKEPSRWEKEIALFQKLLADPKGQAIVIVGPEKSGKSTLLRNMVILGEKAEEFHCESQILHTGPNDKPIEVLRRIGRWPSGTVAHVESKTILGTLSDSVKEFGDLHRRVVGVDANPTQPAALAKWWLEIIPQLPDKVKFIFTQRPDDILVLNKEFMGLSNVVRIDIEAPKFSDGTNPVREYHQAFMRFLSEEKGYPNGSFMSEGSRQDSGEYLSDIEVNDPDSKQRLTVIEVNATEEGKLYVREKSKVTEKATRLGIPLFVLTKNSLTSGDMFGIMRLTEKGDLENVALEDFPTFDELLEMTPQEQKKKEIISAEKQNQYASFERCYELLSATSKIIVDYAAKLAKQWSDIGALTTSCLLFAFLEKGESKESQFSTAKFLRDKCIEKSSPDDITQKRKEYSENINSYAQSWSFIHTKSCGNVAIFTIDIFQLASNLALKTTHLEKIHVRHLLAALLLYRYPEYVTGSRKTINDLGLTIEWILERFFDHLKQFDEDNYEEWKRIFKEAAGGSEAKIEAKVEPVEISISTYAIGDSETKDDTLGFGPYVEAVAEFLVHEDTQPPLTMSIEGEWGSGKSSFMRQLQKEIRRIYKNQGKEKCFIVEFDPWRHDKDEALWAAFALKFIKDSAISLKKWEKCSANYKLWKLRFQWKNAWLDLIRVVFISLVWILSTVVIAVGLWNGIKLGENGTVVLPKWIGSFVAILVSGWGAFGKIKDFCGSPLAMDLKKYMKRPDYVSKISFLEQFHKDFKKVVRSYAGNERVYVFVDDLDRCEVPKAAELMESINLMLSEEPNLVFIMGMDREKVAAGLAVKHEKLLPYLSGPVINREDIDIDTFKQKSGIRYGYSFIEKFIQIPFALPIPSKKDINNMLLDMVGKTDEDVKTIPSEPLEKKSDITEMPPESPIEPSGTTEKTPVDLSKPKEHITSKQKKEAARAERKEAREEVMLKFEGDDKNFRSVALMVSEAFGNNPRRVKQFVNLFRLRIRTAASTGLITPKERLLTFVQLGKFIGIGLGWPLFVKDLERNNKMLDDLVDYLEGETKQENVDEKIKEWAEDKKLIGLIKSGCFDEKGAKKTGDEYGRFCMRGLDVERLMKIAPRIKQTEIETETRVNP